MDFKEESTRVYFFRKTLERNTVTMLKFDLNISNGISQTFTLHLKYTDFISNFQASITH